MSEVYDDTVVRRVDTERVLLAKILTALNNGAGGGGGGGGITLNQALAYVQAHATNFTQNSVGFSNIIYAAILNLASTININTNTIVLNADGSATFATSNLTISSLGTLNISAGQITLNADGSGTLGGGGISWDTAGNLTQNLVSNSDIEITDTTKGYILKSPNGTRYRLKVDNAGNLGTEAA